MLNHPPTLSKNHETSLRPNCVQGRQPSPGQRCQPSLPPTANGATKEKVTVLPWTHALVPLQNQTPRHWPRTTNLNLQLRYLQSLQANRPAYRAILGTSYRATHGTTDGTADGPPTRPRTELPTEPHRAASRASSRFVHRAA